MGQRHQLFIKAPSSVFAKSKPEEKNNGLTAWHSQWLYGTLPLGVVKRLLKYDKENASVFKWNGADFGGEPMSMFKDTIKKIMSFDYDNQSLMRFSDEGQYLLNNYLAGDNNDGLTFLIFEDGKRPKYGFMTGNETGGNSMEDGVIVSAKHYIDCYYPIGANERAQMLRGVGAQLAEFIDEHADLLTNEEVKELFPKMNK